ncbi:MAG: succinate dehydrogenase cytochrome b subunit [Breznakibacter sp.]
MSNLFCSSIGKKLIMSLSGLFLVSFLLIHLTLNSFLLIPDEGNMFNAAAHFMATNPLIKVVEPVLAIGFLVHIVYAGLLTAQNRKARGSVRYASGNNTTHVSWSSKNMWVLGLTVLAFLILHLAHFWVKMKITGDGLLTEKIIEIGGVETKVENAYALVNATFGELWIVIVYIIGSLGLSFHLSHGFWSAFQTIGFSNEIWRKRLSCLGSFLAWFIGIGFSVIAVGQYLFFQ